MSRKTTRLMALCLFILAGVLLTRFFHLESRIAGDRLKDWIDGFGPWGPVVKS